MIYFDQAAAMRPIPEILDFYAAALREFAFANQEAGHGLGYRLRTMLETAARESAAALAGDGFDVYWCGSGTEAFNQIAALREFQGGNIVTTALEHPALLAALRRTGAEIRMTPLDSGAIDPGKAVALCDRNTRLIAFHQVQSELGIMQPAEALIAAFRTAAPQTKILVDSIQAAGKFALPVDADFLVASGHKIGAPGGAAAWFCRADGNAGRAIKAQYDTMRGGEYRFGRVEPAACLAFAEAAKDWRSRREERMARAGELSRLLRDALTECELPNGKRIAFPAGAAAVSPYILHFVLPGYQSAVVIRMLSGHGIYCAAGSACQAESGVPSAALAALGWDKRDGHSGMRLSFGPDNTPEEAETFMNAFRQTMREY